MTARTARRPAADRLLTVEEVAELTTLSRWTLYDYGRRPHLPQPVRVSNRIRWRERDVLAWIKAA